MYRRASRRSSVYTMGVSASSARRSPSLQARRSELTSPGTGSFPFSPPSTAPNYRALSISQMRHLRNSESRIQHSKLHHGGHGENDRGTFSSVSGAVSP